MTALGLYKQRLRDRKGQSAIEFMTIVVVLLFFLLFFLSLSILLVISDYVEFAAFMAARTYKSMFSSEAIQRRNAQTVFDSYTSKIQGIAKDFQLEFLDGGELGPQGAGVRATYKIPLFYLPPLYVPEGIPTNEITLSTETRLGRDTSYEECQGFFEQFTRRFSLGIEGTSFMRQMDDNGC